MVSSAERDADIEQRSSARSPRPAWHLLGFLILNPLESLMLRKSRMASRQMELSSLTSSVSEIPKLAQDSLTL
ncbi:MAG: hypothetical protein DWH91_13365 [Planctomycetota bacterium]|nr:MAG: hypothetical protein DWH91_13365 [Planctomycetota bacterium]